jgi:sulfur carrier protein ThiS
MNDSSAAFPFLKITVRLYGSLRDTLPREENGRVVLELPSESTAGHIVQRLSLRGHLQIAVNGTVIPDWDHHLRPGDHVDIFHPAGGG